MYQFKCTLGAALMAASGTASAAVIYVDADATGLDNGTSWANAYTDLVDALAAAAPGDDIWIAEGVYTPETAPPRLTTLDGSDLCVTYGQDACDLVEDNAHSFLVPAGVDLLGGFSGTETDPSQRTLTRSATQLSGDLLQNDVAGTPSTFSDNAYQVVIISGSDTNATEIDRLTISGGRATAQEMVFTFEAFGEFAMGAGLVLVNGSCSLADVRFTDNVAIVAGGAMAVLTPGDVDITDSEFDDNAILGEGFAIPLSTDVLNGDGGGAIWSGPNSISSGPGDLSIFDSTFTNNDSTNRDAGGAISYIAPTSGSPKLLTLTDSTFDGNTGGEEDQFLQTDVDPGASTIETGNNLIMTRCTVTNASGGTPVSAGRPLGTVTVIDSTFEDNVATNPGPSPSGAGALSSPSTTTISGSSFINNRGPDQGAVAIFNNATITDSTFIDNASTDGTTARTGAVELVEESIVDRCEFRGNSTARNGGGLWFTQGSRVTNCVFVGNSAENGGGLYIDDDVPIGGITRVINCTFNANTATTGGGIFRNANGTNDPTVEIRNTILWGNTDSVGTLSGQIAGTALPGLDVAFSLVEDPASSFGGAGMLYADPLFLDPTNGDVRIEINSPARETGDNAALDLDGDSVVDITEDLPGGARVQGPGGGTVDMGAYEECFADYNGDGSVNFFDQSDFIADYNAQNPRADLFPPGGDGMFNFFDFNEWLVIYDGGTPCN